MALYPPFILKDKLWKRNKCINPISIFSWESKVYFYNCLWREYRSLVGSVLFYSSLVTGTLYVVIVESWGREGVSCVVLLRANVELHTLLWGIYGGSFGESCFNYTDELCTSTTLWIWDFVTGLWIKPLIKKNELWLFNKTGGSIVELKNIN